MKLSQINYLKEQMKTLPKDIDLAEQIRIIAKNSGIDMESAYQEMEMDDLYVDTHEDPGISPEGINLHSHVFYEILYICSGNIQYLIKTERYQIQPGDIIIVPPGVGHQPILTDLQNTPYRRYVLWLSPLFMKGVTPLFPDYDFSKPRLLRTSGTKWAILKDKFHAGILEAEQKRPGWNACVYGNTLELVTLLYRATVDKKSTHLKSEKPELLENILIFIESNLAQNLSLDDTGRRFFVSRSTISNTFRKEMGISFYQYVTQRRLVAAKNLILENIPMEIIAGQVGFSDYSSFYRAFKSEYGISPRQFRDQQREV